MKRHLANVGGIFVKYTNFNVFRWFISWSNLRSKAGIALTLCVIATCMLATGASAKTLETIFYACENNSTGHIAFIATRPPDCPSGFTLVSWNQQGPAGPQGAPGAPGAPGSP